MTVTEPEGDSQEPVCSLLREVRRRGHQAENLPAVALTAFAHNSDARDAVLAGFQIHIPKPINVGDLTAVIARLTGGPA